MVLPAKGGKVGQGDLLWCKITNGVKLMTSHGPLYTLTCLILLHRQSKSIEQRHIGVNIAPGPPDWRVKPNVYKTIREKGIKWVGLYPARKIRPSFVTFWKIEQHLKKYIFFIHRKRDYIQKENLTIVSYSITKTCKERNKASSFTMTA